jgi:carboxypeptidase D
MLTQFEPLMHELITANLSRGFGGISARIFFATVPSRAQQTRSPGARVLGYWGSERDLTLDQIQLSGHEVPGYAPGAAYCVLEVLLGRTANLFVVGDFTTQMGNYSRITPIPRREEHCF